MIVAVGVTGAGVAVSVFVGWAGVWVAAGGRVAVPVGIWIAETNVGGKGRSGAGRLAGLI